jgi:hypothetical protein
MSPPTVTNPPYVRVWPATTTLEISETEKADVVNVVGWAGLMITAPSLGDREMLCPS